MKHFVIDGYNLMHVLGVMPVRPGPAGLPAARLRFLDLLADRCVDRGVGLAVVFDAANAPRRVPSLAEHRGITVHSARHEEADDLIEALIQSAALPRELTVVSNDRRLRRAAQRRGCIWLRCESFIDWLLHPAKQDVQPQEQPDRPVAGDPKEWLREFGHLDDDPELGRPIEFPDDDER